MKHTTIYGIFCLFVMVTSGCTTSVEIIAHRGASHLAPENTMASVMLGWSLFHSHNLDGAETRFRAALNDRSGRVRTSAQKGLRAVQQRRQAAAP